MHITKFVPVNGWTRLDEIQALLEPFAEQTNLLQSDAQSLSSIVPSILNLQCHPAANRPATEVSIDQDRCSYVTERTSQAFSANRGCE